MKIIPVIAVVNIQTSKIEQNIAFKALNVGTRLDWLQSLNIFFINVSFHILAAYLTPMALFFKKLKQTHQS